MILLIMCFVISYFSILTHDIGLQINRYSFVLETKYSNSKNCYSFQHYMQTHTCTNTHTPMHADTHVHTHTHMQTHTHA